MSGLGRPDRRAAADALGRASLDYGIGNLHSAHKALERQGADARLTADPGLIADAVAVVLPGRRRVRGVHGRAARAPAWRSRR